jgi:hypothetical protein
VEQENRINVGCTTFLLNPTTATAGGVRLYVAPRIGIEADYPHEVHAHEMLSDFLVFTNRTPDVRLESGQKSRWMNLSILSR